MLSSKPLACAVIRYWITALSFSYLLIVDNKLKAVFYV